MKLKIYAVDFEEHTITFLMDKHSMERRAFGNGEAEVDINAISQSLEDRAAGKPFMPGQPETINAFCAGFNAGRLKNWTREEAWDYYVTYLR